jgi:hypothetical protein
MTTKRSPLEDYQQAKRDAEIVPPPPEHQPTLLEMDQEESQ